jgi:hypothetical protein
MRFESVRQSYPNSGGGNEFRGSQGQSLVENLQLVQKENAADGAKFSAYVHKSE